jgi:hypothetical protein
MQRPVQRFFNSREHSKEELSPSIQEDVQKVQRMRRVVDSDSEQEEVTWENAFADFEIDDADAQVLERFSSGVQLSDLYSKN